MGKNDWLVDKLQGLDDQGFIEVIGKITDKAIDSQEKPKDGLIMIGDVEGNIDERVANWGKFNGISSGWQAVDCLTYGWEAGELVILGGEPGVGKTFFIIQLAINIATNSKKPIMPTIVSLEISQELLAARAAVSYGANWRELNIILQEEQIIRRRDFAGIIKNAKDGGSEFIIVDYLQMLKDDTESEHREISRIVRELKMLALKHKVTILAISSLNRGRDPELGLQAKDLHGSGSIEFYADQILFIERSDNEGYVKIKIIKNRSNPLNKESQELLFDGKQFKDDWVQPVHKQLEINKRVDV